MKIKTWLLIAFLLVMILPLLSAYILFASITSFHNDQKVEEYYEAYSQIQSLKMVLNDVKWYDRNVNKEEIDQLANDEIAINLYNVNGLNVYESNPNMNYQNTMNPNLLYRNLYEVEEGLRAFTYKEPVFDDGNIVGFFTIEIARDELITTIVRRGWIVIGLFIASFITIFAAVSYVVNKRLSKRLYGLMDEMSAFADGKIYPKTSIGKDEIGELKEHFYRMKKQINTAQKEIKQEQREKEYMVATISHDLKTPLTSIKAYAESLNTATSGLTEEDKLTYQRIIIDKSDFIKQMLDDLMIYSLLQSQDYKMDLVPVDGEEFFDMLISDYEALCERKRIDLTVYNLVTGSYEVNPKQLMRVTDNLMANAIRHTPEKGSIWIAAISNASQLENWIFEYVLDIYTFDFENFAYLIVQNEGDGIPPEKVNYLFDALFQADQARSKKGSHGTGLGLSITKKVIEKHGGEVSAVSKLEHGACFICSIPKRRKET